MVKQKDLWRNIIHNLGNIFFFPPFQKWLVSDSVIAEKTHKTYIIAYTALLRQPEVILRTSSIIISISHLRLAFSQLPAWSVAWFLFFFSTCRGAGFLFSSCIYSTEERKTDPWSSYLHNAQKHLSQDSCWWIEASGDTAVDHLPLIILNSFSVNRSSEWGWLRR